MSMKPTPGTKAPALSLPLVGGGTWTLADQKPEALTMIIVYRGLHCPVCKTFVAELLEPKMDAFIEAGVNVVAVSMDPEDRAIQAKADWGLEKTPVAFGMTEAMAREWGLYITTSIKEAETDVFAEPGTFWITKDGTLYLVDIANMPFARPNLDILLSKVPAVANGYPPRGTKA